MSKLVGLSGVRVANPHQKDAVMLLPSLRQIDPAGRKGEGMDAGGQRRRCPQTSWVCDRGIGEGRGLTETVRLSGRDGSGGALIATSLSSYRSDARTLSRLRIRSKARAPGERERDAN